MPTPSHPTAPEPGTAEAARPRRDPAVRLGDLATALGARLQPATRTAAGGSDPADSADVFVHGITLDSRAVREGDLWCALPGARAHGAEFAAQAAGAGAVAALTDSDGAARCGSAGLAVLVVPDPRAATARAASAVLGDPSARLAAIGVTGTNGKTSVTTMLHGTLLDLGRTSGVIGTAGTRYRDREGREHTVATVRTTPEAPEVQGILALMAEDGVETVAMEVSSHAMVLHRADAIRFETVCFTNLTQDHLDFHGDMESYFAAKASLFAPAHARRGIVCVDDEWGRRLAREAGIPVTTYGVREDARADVRAVDLRPDGIGTTFRMVRADGTSEELTSPLPGRHYVANTLALAMLLEDLGIPASRSRSAIARSAVVPGRMEEVAAAPVRGVVDYSHTEDALIQALTTLRSVPGTERLIAVIGAGGDRDRSKRPLMGAAAARLADVVVVTDDNPRSEDPSSIREQVLAGIPAGSAAEVHEVADRAEAITRAARIARDGDLVLVAGKGAETGQDVGGRILPFDDRVHLRAALEARLAHPDQERGL